MSELKPGDLAPDFTLPATGDRQITLSAHRGRRVVLYFYPKDNTPGCTTEGEAFRDHYAAFQALSCDIFGLSRDSLKAHQNFCEKYQFPFTLLSDSDAVVCHLYDVLKEKKLYGRTSIGIERSTFLIDSDGTILRIWRQVKVAGHVEEVLAAVEQLTAIA